MYDGRKDSIEKVVKQWTFISFEVKSRLVCIENSCVCCVCSRKEVQNSSLHRIIINTVCLYRVY